MNLGIEYSVIYWYLSVHSGQGYQSNYSNVMFQLAKVGTMYLFLQFTSLFLSFIFQNPISLINTEY